MLILLHLSPVPWAHSGACAARSPSPPLCGYSYFENSDRYGSSVLDLIVQPDGSLHSVHVSEVACIGWRDKK